MVSIGVAIPAHPARLYNGMLQRALNSAIEQELKPTQFSINIDWDKRGAAWTRQQALNALKTDYVAFLDSDDYWYKNHLSTLYNLLIDNDADFAYSWFDGNNPFPQHRGKQVDLTDFPHRMHHLTMTVLVKTTLAKEAGFYQDEPMHQDWSGEDWQFILKCAELGAKFIGTGEITWHYAVHQGNTSGLPNKGDALWTM